MPQPTLAQLGSAVRAIRNERKMTIEALADAADLHTLSVSRTERGEQNITWESLASIATALDVDLIDVVRRASASSASRAD